MNAIHATITGNTISNSGHYIADKNKPPNRSGVYVMYGARNIEISGNRCFEDQPNKTQTWGVILQVAPGRADPRFAPTAIQHVLVRNNDLRGNIYSKGLLDESGTRDKIRLWKFPSLSKPLTVETWLTGSDQYSLRNVDGGVVFGTDSELLGNSLPRLPPGHYVYRIISTLSIQPQNCLVYVGLACLSSADAVVPIHRMCSQERITVIGGNSQGAAWCSTRIAMTRRSDP